MNLIREQVYNDDQTGLNCKALASFSEVFLLELSTKIYSLEFWSDF